MRNPHLSMPPLHSALEFVLRYYVSLWNLISSIENEVYTIFDETQNDRFYDIDTYTNIYSIEIIFDSPLTYENTLT